MGTLSERVRLSRAVLFVALIAAVAACATPRAGVPAQADGTGAATAGFVFERDSFAFPNLIRARNPNVEGLYANYCFVLARGIRQFFQFARFDAAGPRLSHAEYVERVRQVASRAPWRAPLPPEARIVIPGYANLREFSRAEEAAVKEGLSSRFWTLVHWTNWRVGFSVSRAGQARVADTIVTDLRQGRLVQLLVTNLPKVELNHTVVVYGYRVAGQALTLMVWDPNNPGEPGLITFDTTGRRFWATQVYDTEFGNIRVHRMYYSWFL